ncbi:ABC transporter permease [Aquibium sp. A9E412]|uniref:ABC transporter permease n=1 Tax=Aquibium sp. A9E412 TaxID=2976767 RepID=UPI0025B26106|nr:ABC transporter permease [Aquibium sp. A9E412]MDN2565605.1 ABC transporter permease [Aquibium sp. A9E412]
MVLRSSPYMRVLLVAVLGFLTAPLLLVFPVSFTPNRYLSMPEGAWSLRHYESFFTDPAWLGSTGSSLTIALATAVICTVLATAFVVGSWLDESRWNKLLFAVVLLPMLAPQIVSSVILFFLEGRLGLIDSFAGLVLAHTVMAVPYSVLAVYVSTVRLDRSMVLASRGLGAGTWQTVLFVIIPNIRLGIVSAAFLAFILSWEEIVVTLFISGINVVTLPKRIWDGLRYNVDPVIAATAVLLMSLTILVVIVRALFLLHQARRGGG